MVQSHPTELGKFAPRVWNVHVFSKIYLIAKKTLGYCKGVNLLEISFFLQWLTNCNCGNVFECREDSRQKFIHGHNARTPEYSGMRVKREIRFCQCSCGYCIEASNAGCRKLIEMNTDRFVHVRLWLIV